MLLVMHAQGQSAVDRQVNHPVCSQLVTLTLNWHVYTCNIR